MKRFTPDSKTTKLITDIAYADTNNPRQMLDLMLPVSPKSKKLPIIVYIHGGAWSSDDKSMRLELLADYVASEQYIGASINYRHSGDAKWPSQIHDCKAAIRWIRAHAEKYHIDADRIGVWGESAGGHLVAMLGTSNGVSSMDGSLGSHTDVSSTVSCVVDFFGPSDFLQMDKAALRGSDIIHDSASSPESKLIGGAIQDNPDVVATANPITYTSSDAPPILIVHGSQDPLVSFNQSELLHQALKKTGVSSTLITVDGGGHGFSSREVDELVSKFFDHHLRGKKTNWANQTVLE
jgi:acetyl esterase/lipase